MVELEAFTAAAPYWVAAAFSAVHLYGAYVCARVLAAIEGTPHETDVRELMPEMRQDMFIVELPVLPRYWLKRRPSVFGYHALNATVWLAIHANRFTIPDHLVEDAHLLRTLRWIEVGLLVGLPIAGMVIVWTMSR